MLCFLCRIFQIFAQRVATTESIYKAKWLNGNVQIVQRIYLDLELCIKRLDTSNISINYACLHITRI